MSNCIGTFASNFSILKFIFTSANLKKNSLTFVKFIKIRTVGLWFVGWCWRVIETEILYNATKRGAETASDDADDAYRDALSIYTESESIRVTEIDVDVINADANQIKTEVYVRLSHVTESTVTTRSPCFTVLILRFKVRSTDAWRARRARAYNGGLGAEPPAGSRGRAPGQGGEAPWSWKPFSLSTSNNSEENHLIHCI